jgi:hypothetical protein
MLAAGFQGMTCISLRKFSYIPTFLKVLPWKVIAFKMFSSASIEILMFFFVSYVSMRNYIDFQMLNQSFNPHMNTFHTCKHDIIFTY